MKNKEQLHQTICDRLFWNKDRKGHNNILSHDDYITIQMFNDPLGGINFCLDTIGYVIAIAVSMHYGFPCLSVFLLSVCLAGLSMYIVDSKEYNMISCLPRYLLLLVAIFYIIFFTFFNQ